MPEPTKEQIFADIAYAYIKENAPSLAKRVAGFQILESSDDSDRAAGMYAFDKDDGSRLYMPMLFVNGALKGAELLYDPKSDVFHSSEEASVSKLLAKDSSRYGQGVPNKPNDLGTTAPDMSVFQGRKVASFVRGQEFNPDPVLVAMFDPTKLEDPSVKAAAARCDLRAFVTQNPQYFSLLKQAFAEDEQFANAVCEFYDPDQLFAPLPFKSASILDVAGTGHKKEKSSVTPTDAVTQAKPPCGAGLYSTLTYKGEEPCFVFPNVVTVGEGDCNVGLLVNKTSGTFAFTMNSQVVTVDGGDREAMDKEMKDISSVKTGDTGIFVVGDKCTVPVKVTEKADGVLTVQVCTTYDRMPAHDSRSDRDQPYPSISHNYGGFMGCCPPCGGESRKYTAFDGITATVYVKSHRSFAAVRDTLIVSDKAKFLPVKDVKPENDSKSAPLSHLDLHLRKIASHVEIYAGPDAWQIRGDRRFPPGQKEACLRILTDDFLVDADEASDMLATAKKAGVVGYWVKRAYIDPKWPEEPVNSVDSFLGVQVTQPETRESYGQSEYRKPSFEEIQRASHESVMAASETGQKEVFDAAGLGRIIHSEDPQGQARSYIADLQKSGLDRLGRLLMLYYWKNDEFRGEYGDEKMKELEDKLKGAFKSLSKLLLMLQDRRPDDGYMMMAGGQNELAEA